MNTKFFIHYEDFENSHELELKILCESLIWFDSLIKEIVDISKIKIDLEIKAQASQEWSYVEALILNFNLINSVPFDNFNDLKSFLYFTNKEFYDYLLEYFSNIDFNNETQKNFFVSLWDTFSNKYEKVEKLAAEHPIGYDLLKYLLYSFTAWWFYKLHDIKKQIGPEKNMPLTYFRDFKNIVKKWKAKKALSPLIENESEKIWFSSNGKLVDNKSIIDRKNFGDFLPDDEKIFSELNNWDVDFYIGSIENFHWARWDYMKINIDLGKYWKQILIVRPDEEHTTKDFRNFYKEVVRFKGEILRESYFEKPKIKIIWWMEKFQLEINLEN